MLSSGLVGLRRQRHCVDEGSMRLWLDEPVVAVGAGVLMMRLLVKIKLR